MVQKKRMSQRGFTIVEVVVTIGVFGIGMVTLATLMASVQQSQRSARYLEVATQAARAKIEKIRNSEFDTITSGASFTSDLPAGLPAGSTGTVTVSVPANAPRSKHVDAKIVYPVGSLSKEVTISAYVDKPGDS